MSDTHNTMSTETPNPTPTGASRGVTPALWAAILEAGRKGGLLAARLVYARGRPTQADGRPAGTRGLDAILQREPFKSEWQRAEDEFLSQFVDLAHKAATTTDVVERYDPKTGRLVERREDSRNRNWMLIQTLRRYSPDWREQKRVAVDGQIQHTHSLGARPDQYILTGEEVLSSLEPHEQEALFALLEKVEAHRMENRNGKRELIDEPKPARRLPPPQSEGGEVEPY